MSTIAYMKKSIDFAHRALTDARTGTPEQLNFIPEDGSHSIAWCLWHTARVEDLIINARTRNAPQVWSQEWADRTGLPFDGFGTNMSDEEAAGISIKDIGALGEYQQAVWDQTAAYLDSITDEDLEREIPSRTGTETVGEGIFLHMIGHFNGHRGEINLLRGMQGMPPLLAVEGTH